jgi:DNA repair exonuclease SbcCD ATPase subunit
VEAELQRKQREIDRLKTLLEERGGEGLYARLADAEERLEAAAGLAERLRREGLAARLVRELIQRREQASIRAVLSPLEDRLTETFAALTGIPGRRVWFDEHLAVKGVGARSEEMVPFASLSRGAREQMLLALRAAIALQVAASDGPQCLVLDDVLVHTDAARHENVLDFLQSLSSQVQILLLTCHGERYRGLGHVVPVERRAPA